MRITVIIGSQRSNSQSSKVGSYVAQQLKNKDIEVDIIDLGKNKLPYFDDDCNPNTESGKDIWASYAHTLHASDGFVIISPERSGMVPAALKNIFLRCKSGELAHKPALIITVSSGTGGAYPVAELRMSSYKNTKIVYLPDHVIVRDVNNVLNGEETEANQRIERRIDYALRMLIEYSKGFQIIRISSVVVDEANINGM